MGLQEGAVNQTKRQMELEWNQPKFKEFTRQHYLKKYGWRTIYPFDDMNIGDYLYLESEEEAKKVRMALTRWYKDHDDVKCYVISVGLEEWICRRYE
jgi:hypothetical protein